MGKLADLLARGSRASSTTEVPLQPIRETTVRAPGVCVLFQELGPRARLSRITPVEVP
ncbi:MAG: hypothetical protein QOJ67_4035 [Acidimicrobiaceae bacterium]|jgi:hypothetical protein